MSVETLKNGALRNAFPDGRPERLEGAGGDMMAMAVSLFDGVAAKVRLTPDRLVNIITQADGGDPREQAVLFSTVLEKEPIVASHLQTRRLAVQSCPWSVQSKAQPALAEEIQEELLRAGIRQAIGHLLDCIGTGYSGAVVDWAKGGAGINGFVPISPDVWTFDEGGYPAITTIDGKNEVPLAKYHPAQILYVVNDGKAGLPCRKGVLRTLLWMHLFKNSSFRDWAVFLERFGIPFILGKIPSGDFFDAKKREELLKGIMGIRSGGAGVGTVETEMQILNGASSGNQQAYEGFQRYCDEIMTLVILGQRASSDAAGGLSKGTAQEAVRQDLLAADCGIIEEAVQKTCVEWLCRLKHGMADAGDIRFKIDCALPEDMNTRAERDLKISQATGCRLSRKYAMETYGVELEEPTPPPDPLAQMRQGEFSDRPFDLAARRREAAWRLTRATVRRMMDEDVFEAWRGPIEAAARRAFGDIDPEAEDAIEQFGKRVPDFLAALPGILDHFAPEEFCRVMRGGVLASFLNSLPPNALRKRNIDGAEAFWDGQPRKPNGQFTFGKMPSYTIVKQPGWHFKGVKTNEKVKEIKGILGDTKLANKDIPGNVGFYTAGVKHIVGYGDTSEIEHIIRSPKILQEIFSQGKCAEEPVHDDKPYADRCWHVKRTCKINGITSRFEFVVLHHLDIGGNVLYDIKCGSNKKRP
ncbi:MAG: DUF935 family protein [Victivallales bacterium]|nr:DUF935 family protein [Victivallales bacterium]